MDGGCRASSLGVLINKLSQSCKAPSNRLPLSLSFCAAKSSPRHCLWALSQTLDVLLSKSTSYRGQEADGGDLRDTNLEVSLAHARTHGQQTSTYGPRSGTAADVQPAERLSSFRDGEMTDHVLQSAPKSFTLSPCNL